MAKIITIGKGNLEKRMIEILLENGYTSPFSILRHVKDEDVTFTLQLNLKGLQALFIAN